MMLREKGRERLFPREDLKGGAVSVDVSKCELARCVCGCLCKRVCVMCVCGMNVTPSFQAIFCSETKGL